jgi:hypothetical protein
VRAKGTLLRTKGIHMHVHHADRNHSQSPWGCGRDADTALTLRRKALPEVSAAAASETPVNPGCVNASTFAVSASPTMDTSTYELSAMRRQKGSLSILTQDGDRVRIRFRSSEALALQNVTTVAPDTSTSTTTVYAFASGRVQVGVEGELDADELKAIGDLMEKVDALAAQFFDGDAQAAFSAAAELGFDAGEIAGFALRLSVKEFARAIVQEPAVEPSGDAIAPGSAPAPAPMAATAAPVATSPAPEPAVEPETAPTTSPPEASPGAATGTPVDPAASLQQSLGGFLKQVLDGLSSINGTGRAEFSLRWKLQVMIAAVQSAPAATTSDSAGPKLASESLSALASTQA